MPDHRTHRGAHPEDRELFGPAALPVLTQAAEEYAWLLDRGYPAAATLTLVGDRHRLRQRQRTALSRGVCDGAARALRRSRELLCGQLDGRPLRIDGYNLLTTVEAALGGGVILLCRDGCCRDMASMHGTYRAVAETLPALERIGAVLERAAAGEACWLLDRPVSNSGRLRRTIEQLAAAHGWPWQVELAADPDAQLLAEGPLVVTADSGVLDRCGAWWNLARRVVEAETPQAWVVELAGGMR